MILQRHWASFLPQCGSLADKKQVELPRREQAEEARKQANLQNSTGVAPLRTDTTKFPVAFRRRLFFGYS